MPFWAMRTSVDINQLALQKSFSSSFALDLDWRFDRPAELGVAGLLNVTIHVGQ